MADARAMEEQKERMNPVEPLKEGTRRGRTSLVLDAPEYVGGGATPSMGLSQIRGGRKRKASPPSEDGLSGGRIIGAGTKKGQTRKTARKAYEDTPEEMGKTLASHIGKLHGAGFLEDFKRGMTLGTTGMTGGANVSGPGYEALAGGVRTGAYEGKGKLLIKHLPDGEGEEMMVGSGKKKRRPAGPNDARRRRGAMVSKLMKEQGMSLAEASRHIKEHGMA